MYKNHLIEAISRVGNHLCVGVDLHLKTPSSFLAVMLEDVGPIKTAENISSAIIEEAADKAPVVKFQMSFFEALGGEGFTLLKKMIRYAKEKKLLVILDGKRGDIASTMSAYAQMAYNYFDADALTINPYMGSDVLKPLIPWLEKGKGCYSLFLTSNNSGYPLQREKTKTSSSIAHFFWQDLLRLAKESGVEDALGLVVGAQALGFAAQEIPDLLCKTPLLIPGFGAQGASFKEIEKDFLKNPCFLANQSRSLSGLHIETSPFHHLEGFHSYLEKRITEEADLHKYRESFV